MILETLFGFSLLLNASLDAPVDDEISRMAWLRMLVPPREAALAPLVPPGD